MSEESMAQENPEAPYCANATCQFAHLSNARMNVPCAANLEAAVTAAACLLVPGGRVSNPRAIILVPISSTRHEEAARLYDPLPCAYLQQSPYLTKLLAFIALNP